MTSLNAAGSQTLNTWGHQRPVLNLPALCPENGHKEKGGSGNLQNTVHLFVSVSGYISAHLHLLSYLHLPFSAPVCSVLLFNSSGVEEKEEVSRSDWKQSAGDYLQVHFFTFIGSCNLQEVKC